MLNDILIIEEALRPTSGAPERIAAASAVERLVARIEETNELARRVRDGLISDEDAVEELRFLAYRQ
jgi:hypothetical protein